MNSEPVPVKPQPGKKNLQIRSPISDWLGRITRRFNISSKIVCGYSLSLGIAVLGTFAGLSIGNYWENQASIEAEKWHETGVLLSKLQVAVLQARSHQQQLIALIEQPEKYKEERSHFVNHINQLKTLISQIDSSEAREDLEELKHLLQTYDGTVENYFQQIQVILNEIDRANLKLGRIIESERLLLKFTNSEIALKFDEFSDDLSKIVEAAFAKENEANEALEQGEMVQVYAPMVSMVISVAIAAILAIYTSRAIARPLRTATKVAQQVTEDANFDLQVPVTTEDEVGVLSASLNQLIGRVKQLLEEQKAASELQQQMQKMQLIQNEKMASLGKLVAGVAHEINNPVNFIYGNINYAKEYVEALLEMLEIYQKEIVDTPEKVKLKAEDLDLEFLAQDLPKILESMTIGAERVREIVFSLKDFSRLDEAVYQSVDLHACLNSTLLILHSRFKKGINVVCNYGEIPKIEGYTGFLYQVFMNLLSNAIDALEEPTESQITERSKQIVITTERQDKDWVIVRIVDNGAGISPENIPRIFDTFFTTKPRGIGTGLGLAITRQIVEEKHKGKIICRSEVGKGTEFEIYLPIAQSINLGDREIDRQPPIPQSQLAISS